MRLPSLDLGNKRQQAHRDKMPSMPTSESTRSLGTVLRNWQYPPPGTAAVVPPGTEGMRGSTLPTRSASSRSLASKLSRAFTGRKPTHSVDISAPISSSVQHPGLAVTEFGTPIRHADGWNELVPVDRIYCPLDRSDCATPVERRNCPPTLPDIPKTSPMMTIASRQSFDHSSLGSPYFLAPSPAGGSQPVPRSNYSPRHSPLKDVAHARHKSLPTAALLGSPKSYTLPSPQETPTRPRNAFKRGAFYERTSYPVTFDEMEGQSRGRTTPVSPTTSGSPRSTASSQSQFRIRRKPVPKLELDTTEEGLLRNWGHSSRSSSGGSADRRRIASPTPSNESCSPVEEVAPSVAYAVPLPTPRKNESFKQEIDTLFDELMEQCRKFSPESTPTRPKHQRSATMLDQPRGGASDLRRKHATRKSISKPLPSSFSLPTIKQVDDAHGSDKDALAHGDHKGKEKENAEPTTPRPKHHRVSDLRPFVPSGRSFEPIRGMASKSPAPFTPQPTSPNLPSTPRPGHVKHVVRQIERRPDSPVVTPVSKLGSLLQKQVGVDSDELTLESKRMMEEARRRRANTLK